MQKKYYVGSIINNWKADRYAREVAPARRLLLAFLAALAILTLYGVLAVNICEGMSMFIPQ